MPIETLVLLAIVTLGYIALATFATSLIRRARTPAPPPAPPMVRSECRRCVHWDLDAGQHALNTHPTFSEVKKHLPVAVEAYGYKYDEEGNRVGVAGPPEAAALRYEDFGVCEQHGVLIHCRDVCDSFVARPEVRP